jgi:hypothetical protein
MATGDQNPIGPAGVPFPAESEWLDLPMPAADELTIAEDFVERTLRALADADEPVGHAESADDEAPEPMLTADRLRALAAPEPSPGFVDDTMRALREDRKARWRELLTRHIAPEPSPEFVARTLAALAADRSAATGRPAGGGDRVGRLHRWRFSAWPLLAVAAAAMIWLLLRDQTRDPIELRFAQQEPAAFAHAHAATPLAAVLEVRNRARDPYALAEGGPDGTWLLWESER